MEVEKIISNPKKKVGRKPLNRTPEEIKIYRKKYNDLTNLKVHHCQICNENLKGTHMYYHLNTKKHKFNEMKNILKKFKNI